MARTSFILLFSLVEADVSFITEYGFHSSSKMSFQSKSEFAHPQFCLFWYLISLVKADFLAAHYISGIQSHTSIQLRSLEFQKKWQLANIEFEPVPPLSHTKNIHSVIPPSSEITSTRAMKFTLISDIYILAIIGLTQIVRWSFTKPTSTTSPRHIVSQAYLISSAPRQEEMVSWMEWRKMNFIATMSTMWQTR